MKCCNKAELFFTRLIPFGELAATPPMKKPVRRIYQLKKREDSKSMLVLLENINALERYVEEVPEIAYDLIEVTEKPMTIIYSGAKNLAKNLVAEDGSIGIRFDQ